MTGADVPEDRRQYTAESIQLARFEAQLDETRRQVADLNTKLDAVLKDLAKINEKFIEARGGWRLIIALGGLVATASAALAYIAAHVKFTP